MSDGIIYRKPTSDDYIQVEKIIGESFNFKRWIDNQEVLDVFQRNYVTMAQNPSNFQMVAVEDGIVIGVIMASAKNDPRTDLPVTLSAEEQKVMDELMKEPRMVTVKELMEGYNDFIKEESKKYDGSLTLFAVTYHCRGKGVGKMLLQKAREYWERQGAKEIYLYTDNTCSTGFYDHQGFRRMDTKVFNFENLEGAEKMEMYFYDYKI